MKIKNNFFAGEGRGGGEGRVEINVRPYVVVEYKTEGGEVATVWRDVSENIYRAM